MAPLPDTTEWLPRSDKAHPLKNTFLQTCRSIEARIISEANIERSFNIDNYDSGPGVEDFCRSQIKQLLPTRYEAMPGVVISQSGLTCGDCDITIVNNMWLPFVKYGATDESRRIHIPIEAVYSIIEVKQTLTEASLDEAMKKIVMYKRMERGRSQYGRIIENHNLEFLEKSNKSLNYKFDSILTVNCDENKRDALVKRFFQINETLDLSHRVNALAILSHGYACYVNQSDSYVAENLYPDAAGITSRPYFLPTNTDTFYRLWINLWSHLTLTVLNPSEMKNAYGAASSDQEGIFY